MAPKRRSVRERLLLRHKKEGDCWIWTGGVQKDGYGILGVGRSTRIRAHRASYSEFVGEIPDGLLVCHKCDTPLCINPKHLFLGTPKRNMEDMIKKGRKHRMVDTSHPNTKITHKQRKEVIARRSAGETLKEIASDYGVSFQTIGSICNGARSYSATK